MIMLEKKKKTKNLILHHHNVHHIKGILQQTKRPKCMQINQSYLNSISLGLTV